MNWFRSVPGTGSSYLIIREDLDEVFGREAAPLKDDVSTVFNRPTRQNQEFVWRCVTQQLPDLQNPRTELRPEPRTQLFRL